jgi:tripartite-type tricarboxylate transporter receptor subunit TctC
MMKTRREMLAIGGSMAAASLAGLSNAAAQQASDYPNKPIRVIVPAGPGSAIDVVPRIVFEPIIQRLGQPVVFENRAGGSTALGAIAVAKSDPDGYTLMSHSNALITVPVVQPSIPSDPVNDLAAISLMGKLPMVLVVTPGTAVKTVKDLIAKAKAKPGSLNYAAAGIGTPVHLTMERFRLAAGFTGQLVPFRSAPEAITEVMTGRVDAYFAPATAAMSLIKDGKVLALAVSGTKRATALPDVPTTIEAGVPDSEFEFWVGAFAPKKTPRPIVQRMHDEIVKAVADPAIVSKLNAIGVEPQTMAPEAFDAQITKETEIVRKIVKEANLETK